VSAGYRDRPFRLDGIDSQRRSLPLAAPLVTARGRYRQRDVVLLRVRLSVDGRGSQGWGEAAPLPGWNEADPDDLIAAAGRLASGSGQRTLDELLREEPGLNDLRALRFGIECAILDALSRADGVPLAAALVDGRDLEPATTIAVQRTLGDCDATIAIAELARARQDGFSHAKLKVGARPLRADLERVRAIAAARPDMTLRLDANGAWGVDEALEMLAALPAGRVEWIEQPVADAELDALLTRYDRVGPAIAADESCADPERAAALLRSGRLGAVVVKPAAVGGLQTAAEVFALAGEAGVAVMISNLMESAVGRAAVAHLAAAWPALPGPHGLATGAWFAHDVAPGADRIEDGRLALRAGPGLGFEPGPV
jgi:o-succinylbenzoate synthase